MLMIISPAKTLDFETPVTTESYSVPDYLEKSAELVEIMKKKSLRDLVNMMQVSQKIAELNVERFKSWKLPFSPGNARQALLALMVKYIQALIRLLFLKIILIMRSLICAFFRVCMVC